MASDPRTVATTCGRAPDLGARAREHQVSAPSSLARPQPIAGWTRQKEYGRRGDDALDPREPGDSRDDPAEHEGAFRPGELRGGVRDPGRLIEFVEGRPGGAAPVDRCP